MNREKQSKGIDKKKVKCMLLGAKQGTKDRKSKNVSE